MSSAVRARWVWPALSGGLLLLLWYAAGAAVAAATRAPGTASDRQRLILPYPHEVADALWEERERLWPATLQSLGAATAGLAAAAALGLMLAVAMASARTARAALEPWVLVVQMFPVVMFAPFLALWGRWGGLPAVPVIAFIIAFFPVVANALQGLTSVERHQVELFRLAPASRWQELWRLRLPAALPSYFTGLRIAASLAMVGALTGDLFAGSVHGGGGLGWQAVVYQQQLKSAAILATGLLACGLGFVFVGGVDLARWWALRRWAPVAGDPGGGLNPPRRPAG